MKKIFLVLILAISALSLAIPEADAKRLGDGSYGQQSQSVSLQSANPSSQSSGSSSSGNSAAAAPQPAPASTWRDAIGGALLGLGLGALMSKLGFNGILGSMIGTLLLVGVIVIVVMLVARIFRRRDDFGMPSGYVGGNSFADLRDTTRVEPESVPPPPQKAGAATNEEAATGIPAGFNIEAFTRGAKTYFIRLQAAWDRADANDIREFTTPEMFEELKSQLQERGTTPNSTTILALDAEVLDVETSNGTHLVTVQFSGRIKEAEDAAPEAFVEVWKLSKAVAGEGGWVLAGIQQLD